VLTPSPELLGILLERGNATRGLLRRLEATLRRLRRRLSFAFAMLSDRCASYFLAAAHAAAPPASGFFGSRAAGALKVEPVGCAQPEPGAAAVPGPRGDGPRARRLPHPTSGQHPRL
jgi:hypothetical protein